MATRLGRHVHSIGLARPYANEDAFRLPRVHHKANRIHVTFSNRTSLECLRTMRLLSRRWSMQSRWPVLRLSQRFVPHPQGPNYLWRCNALTSARDESEQLTFDLQCIVGSTADSVLVSSRRPTCLRHLGFHGEPICVCLYNRPLFCWYKRPLRYHYNNISLIILNRLCWSVVLYDARHTTLRQSMYTKRVSIVTCFTTRDDQIILPRETEYGLISVSHTSPVSQYDPSCNGSEKTTYDVRGCSWSDIQRLAATFIIVSVNMNNDRRDL